MTRRSKQKSEFIDRYIDGDVPTEPDAQEVDPTVRTLIDGLRGTDRSSFGLTSGDVERRARFGRHQRTVRYSVLGLVLALALVAASVASFSLRPATQAGAKSWGVSGYINEPAWQGVAGTALALMASCPSSEDCLVVNEGAGERSVVVTDDFGRTWHSSPLPSGAMITTGITCPTSAVCVFGGEYLGVTGFWRSGDAGTSWTFQSVGPPSGQVNDVVCTSPSHCAATELFLNRTESRSLRGALFLSTDDGGHDWSQRPLPSGFQPSGPSSIVCTDASQCLVAGGLKDFTAGAVVATANDGRSWTLAKASPDVAVVVQLSCVDEVSCLALGREAGDLQQAKVLVSTDAGESWQAAPEATPFAQPNSLECTPAQGCVVGGTALGAAGPVPAIARSFDLGTTWKGESVPAKVPGPSGSGVQLFSVVGLACAPTQSCLAVAVGPGGTSAALTDGG